MICKLMNIVCSFNAEDVVLFLPFEGKKIKISPTVNKQWMSFLQYL